jgi:hypothetical protein
LIAGGLDKAVETAVPEFVGHVGLAEAVGHQVEHGIGAFGPELLGAFEAAVDLFNG